MRTVCFPLSGDEPKEALDIALDLITNIKGYKVIVTLNSENKEIEKILKSYKISYDILGIDRKIFPKESFLKNFFVSYISSPKIFSYLIEKKPDVVHIFDISVALMWNSATKMNGQKVVLSQNTLWDYSYPIRTIAGMADAIISPSKTYAKTLPATVHAKTKILYPFISENDDDFDIRKKMKFKKEDLVFGICASDKAKAISLGENLNKLFGQKIYLILNSKKPFEIKDDDIEIIGAPYSDFPKGADAFIVYDNHNIYKEINMAFRHLVPVFAIRNDETLELIDDGETGFLINSDESDVISNKIVSLWDIRNQTSEIAKSKKLTSKLEYTKEIEAIYKKMLKE